MVVENWRKRMIRSLDMKKIKVPRLLLQYLMSYLCILLIPLFVMGIFVYNYLFNILEDEIQTNNLYTMQRAKDTLETQMDFINSLENTVYLKSKLIPFSLKKDPLQAIEVQQELRKYLYNHSFIYDMVYYQASDEYVIGASSSYFKEAFFEQIYSFKNQNQSTFLNKYEDENGHFYIGARSIISGSEEGKRLVTLVQVLDKENPRYVIYFIDETFFTEIMPSQDVAHEVSFIVSQTGDIIACSGNRTLAQKVAVEHINNANHEDQQDYLEVQGEKYLMSYVYSNDYNWAYISLIPGESISKRIDHVKIIMLGMCLFVATSGTLGGAFFSRYNYAPIRKLEALASDIWDNGSSKNEISHVEKVLEYLKQQNHTLSADEAIKTTAVREQYISKLLAGQFKDEEQIREKGNKVNVQFDKERYCVAIFSMYQLPINKEQEIEDVFINSASKSMDILVRIHPETKEILLVMGYDKHSDDRAITYLSDMLEIMYEDMKLKGIIGMGSPSKEIIKINDSYKEATMALEYKIVLFRQKIIRYEEVLLRDGHTFKISPKHLTSFIRSRNIEGLNAFLTSALEELCWGRATIKQIKKQCNEFIYTLENVITEVNKDIFLDKPLYYDTKDLIKYDNCSELIEIIRLIGCDIIDCMNEMTGRSLVEAMILYVNDNCFSCDFSTTAMAEEFKMSLPYLSQYFKNHAGKNLLDFVTDKKMHRAKELLANTEETIKDIAEQVGYFNVNSFNRRFKQITGCTPGEYRKMKF